MWLARNKSCIYFLDYNSCFSLDKYNSSILRLGGMKNGLKRKKSFISRTCKNWYIYN
ncbi:hypothetical protein BN182_2160058 [Clostridioides difficile E9]|nr:hypothetical protein BN182_2160058 [Clostridioides difficile E9]